MSAVYGVIRKLGATSKYKGYYYVANSITDYLNWMVLNLILKMMHLNWSQRNLWNVRQEPEVCVRSWKVH